MFLLIFNSYPHKNFILFSIADKLNLRSSASLCMRIMYVINSSLCKRAIFPPLPMHTPSEMGRFTLSIKHKKQRIRLETGGKYYLQICYQLAITRHRPQHWFQDYTSDSVSGITLLTTRNFFQFSSESQQQSTSMHRSGSMINIIKEKYLGCLSRKKINKLCQLQIKNY